MDSCFGMLMLTFPSDGKEGREGREGREGVFERVKITSPPSTSNSRAPRSVFLWFRPRTACNRSINTQRSGQSRVRTSSPPEWPPLRLTLNLRVRISRAEWFKAAPAPEPQVLQT